MNDLERDLRQLLDRKAIEGSAAPRPTEGVIRRSRRRQVGTVAISALTVVAVVGVALAGLRTIEQEARRPIPADLDPYSTGRYPIFERTATIEPFTITSPSNWYLVNQWPLTQPLAEGSGQVVCSGSADAVPAGSSGSGASGSSGEVCESNPPIEGMETIPVYRLANQDPGLDLPICGFGGEEPPLQADELVLQVSVDYSKFGVVGGDTPSAPPPALNDTTPTTDGPCGEGRYARFVNGNVPYIAWVGSGQEVDEEERARLYSVFTGMIIGDDVLSEPGARTASYVIAGDNNAFGQWQLELRRSRSDSPDSNIDLSLVQLASGQRLPQIADVRVPEVPIEQGGGDPVFGAVTKEAGSVVLRQESRLSPIPAQLIPLPPSMPFDFDLFVARNEMDVPAKAVALGPNGEQLGAGRAPLPSDPDVVTAEGSDPIPWTLNLSGNVEEGSACIDLDTKRTDFIPFCPGELPTNEPLVRIWSDSGQLFAAGSAPPGTLSVRAEGTASGGFEGVCVHGPGGWGGIDGFVVPLGSLEDGSIVFANGVGQDSLSMDRVTRQLPWNNDDGFITATGEFLGSPWRVEQLFYRDGLRADVGGRIQSIKQPAVDDPIVLSIPGLSYGALLLVLTDLSVEEVDVASEGRWYGRWMPSSTREGDEARLWIVELPGAGSGSLSYDGKDVGSVSWP